ncbi:Hypothetical protein LUCI_4057 [Lucifera butyrica]|uniref:Uncharacterized protein n=1 Tax=Lucifera butyrica TaxID=1351585 RepID=A0A498R7P0_9FIRM|nr:Hypothetical protein LUCI_4057 [Lucifera butyrica]
MSRCGGFGFGGGFGIWWIIIIIILLFFFEDNTSFS